MNSPYRKLESSGSLNVKPSSQATHWAKCWKGIGIIWKNKRKRKQQMKIIRMLNENAILLHRKMNEYERRCKNEEEKAKLILTEAKKKKGSQQKMAKTRAKSALRSSIRAKSNFDVCSTARDKILVIKDTLENANLNINLHLIMAEGTQALDTILSTISLDEIEEMNEVLMEATDKAGEMALALAENNDDDLDEIVEKFLAEEDEDETNLKTEPKFPSVPTTSLPLFDIPEDNKDGNSNDNQKLVAVEVC